MSNKMKINTIHEYSLYLDKTLKDRKGKKELKKLILNIFQQGQDFEKKSLYIDIDNI